MEAYYDAILNPSETSATDETWRRKNATKRPYLDANKLANIRRNIIKIKHLTDAELDDIRTNTIQTNTSPTPREENNPLSTGTNEPEITYEKSKIAVHPQYTDTINLEVSKYQS